MGHSFGRVGGGWDIILGGWGWKGIGGGEWGWVHCLIMPV